MAEVIWKDRKRPFLGLPWSFTKYELTEQKLIINKGFLNVSEEEVRLYRFVDVTMTQTLGQRIFGVGNLHCETNDRSSGNFVIEANDELYITGRHYDISCFCFDIGLMRRHIKNVTIAGGSRIA